MKERLVLAQFAGAAPTPPRSIKASDGVLGITFWQQQTYRSLAIGHYRDEVAVTDHLKAIVESVLENVSDDTPLPYTVSHVVVTEGLGLAIEDSPKESYLLVAHLVTEPGFGEEIQAKAREFLEGFEQHPSFRGYIMGHSESLDEELWLLTAWNESPRIPLLDEGSFEVETYQRV